MVVKYSFQNYEDSTMARSSGANLKVSLKKTVELSRVLKGKRVSTAIDYLEKVIKTKAVVPYRRYKAEVAHKRGKGIDTGGYPVAVAKEVLRLIKSAEKNAKDRELGDNLVVVSVSGRKGATRYHYGRHSGRQMKSTNVEVILGHVEKKKVVKKTTDKEKVEK